MAIANYQYSYNGHTCKKFITNGKYCSKCAEIVTIEISV